jgi:hypothetical protein
MFSSLGDLRAEIDRNLSRGRTFVPDALDIEMRERCVLALTRPDGECLELAAEAVWAEPGAPGAGFELLPSGVDLEEQLEQFVAGQGSSGQARGAPPVASRGPSEAQEEHPGSGEERTRVRNIYDRIRSLSITEQQQLARKGSLTERVALERTYGGAVWEGLLQNPQLTAGEVTKIAKKGNLPQPLLALIISNSAWLSIGEVQRALLSNPRLTGGAITRVLRAMSRRDLARVLQQPGYRINVKSEATRLLKQP